jgi:hypothetical protein
MKRIAGAALLLTFSLLVTGTEGATSRTISWRNPTTYEDGSEIPAALRATVETRLYFSLDRVVWTRFATVSAGEESWTGLLPVEEGIPSYYAVTATNPSEGIESRFSEVIVYPPDVDPVGSPDEVTVTIGKYQDTWVAFGNRSNTNYSAYPLILTYVYRDNHVANRGFLKWDLSSIPANANVSNATLRLYYGDEEGGGGDNAYGVNVAKVVGVHLDIGNATGSSPDTINSWTGGADGGAKNLAPAESTVTVGKNHGWVVWNVTNMVQEWVEAPWTNQGMAIDPDTAATAYSSRYFASREYPDPLLRPELVITYRQSPPSTEQQWRMAPSPPPTDVESDVPADTFMVEIGRYEDTFVKRGYFSDINYSNEPVIRTYTKMGNEVTDRGFIRWDLSGLPADITVMGATLWLYYVHEEVSGIDDACTVSVYKVMGVRPDLGLATWNEYDRFFAWPGVQDGGASTIGTATSSSTIGRTHRWVSWDVTDMVQEWVSKPETNSGIAVEAGASASSHNNRYFASGEYPDPKLRPRLLVTYTISRQGAPLEVNPKKTDRRRGASPPRP